MKINFRKILTIFLPFLFLILTYISLVRTKEVVQTSAFCPSGDFSGAIDFNEKTAIFNGQKVRIPDIAYKVETENGVLGASTENEKKWIEVDLSDQTLRAWDGNDLYLQTLVSTGLPWFPTPIGEFRIWVKLRASKMEGGEGRYYYNLPNVPFVMYLTNDKVPKWKGYGLHGTYWHHDFGRQHSHGCVNLPTDMAEKLYYWAGPVLPGGKTVVFSSPENPGTRVVIHK